MGTSPALAQLPLNRDGSTSAIVHACGTGPSVLNWEWRGSIPPTIFCATSTSSLLRLFEVAVPPVAHVAYIHYR